ncbi:MAG: ZIP family metal transporter [Candidatus Paceibacterota bacterium]
MGFVLAGVLGVVLLFRVLPGFHHHHDEEHEGEPHSHIDARKIVFSDAVHNIGDGVLLASSFAVNLQVGIVVTLSILVHEAIQEISEFFVLRQAGYSVKKALRLNFLASATVLIGSIGGFFLLENFGTTRSSAFGCFCGSFFGCCNTRSNT